MVQGPRPPTAAQYAAFDKEWGARAHRNVCVTLKGGSATIAAPGNPDYELYYVPKSGAYAQEVDGRIAITSPTDAGTVCLGIAKP